VIAGTADEIVQTSTFASEDEDAGPCEIELVVVGSAALVETDDPEIVLFELLEGAHEVDDADDAKMLGGSGAGFDGGGTERGGTALGEEDAVDARAVGDAQKGAEVLRVFDAVEGEKKAGSGRVPWRGREEVFEGEKFLWTDEGDDALMGGNAGKLGKLVARFLAHAHASLAAIGHQAGKAVVVTLAGDEHLIKAAAAGFERLLNRMEAVENIHTT